jgi:zinc protease
VTPPSAAIAVADRLPRLPGELTIERLSNGLTVALQTNRQAPVVSSALWYRAGTRDEAPGLGGAAHFLEHMMFKGSERYGPGEIDRRTQALGGANNAFTSHDATVYWFQLSADRWTAALDFEVDRMRGLLLDPSEVDSERKVILEEIGMYEDDPWDALSQRVEAALFLPHPYGRPVLGTREDLLATGPDELRAFHGRFYVPGNAVLVVAGDFGDPARALDAVAATFGEVPGTRAGSPHSPSIPLSPRGERGTPPPDPRAPEVPSSEVPGTSGGEVPEVPGTSSVAPGVRRVVHRKGETGRMLLATTGPPADHEDLPALRLALAVLGVGRSSRLYRELVDERQLCAWAAVGMAEAPDPGAITVSAEILDDSDPLEVEAETLRQLAGLLSRPPGEAEIDRAREVLYADWIFGHEKIAQQGLTVGSDLTFFGPGWAEGQIRSLAEVEPEAVRAAAGRYLDPAGWMSGRGGLGGAVLGWALPAGGHLDLETEPVRVPG